MPGPLVLDLAPSGLLFGIAIHSLRAFNDQEGLLCTIRGPMALRTPAARA
jgi:hypothetical protein